MKKYIYHEKNRQKETRMGTVISNKADFKRKKYTRSTVIKKFLKNLKNPKILPKIIGDNKQIQWSCKIQKSMNKNPLCSSMDGTGEHYAKWNNPGDKRHTIWSHL